MSVHGILYNRFISGLSEWVCTFIIICVIYIIEYKALKSREVLGLSKKWWPSIWANRQSSFSKLSSFYDTLNYLCTVMYMWCCISFPTVLFSDHLTILTGQKTARSENWYRTVHVCSHREDDITAFCSTTYIINVLSDIRALFKWFASNTTSLDSQVWEINRKYITRALHSQPVNRLAFSWEDIHVRTLCCWCDSQPNR